MKTIEVYDRPGAAPLAFAGTDMDTDLVNFAAMLLQLDTHSIKVERRNQGQQSMAFVRNPSDVAGWSSPACSGQ